MKKIIITAASILAASLMTGFQISEPKELKTSTQITSHMYRLEFANKASRKQIQELAFKTGKHFEEDVEDLALKEDEYMPVQEPVPEPTSTNESLAVPLCDTSFKAYMDYRTLTVASSDQYKIQHSAYIWTDVYGLRRYNEDYVVAVGTYYTPNCGARFKVTFDTGSAITVLVGDIKADIHTDPLHQYRAVYDSQGNFYSANVLEFIVDTDLLPRSCKLMGSVGTLDHLSGNIKSIERL